MPTIQHKGSNLPGGDSPYTRWPATGPVSGTHYQFMSFTEVDYHLAKGQNTFRLLFTWEALQPTEYAVLATLSGNYAIYRDKLYALADYITSKGVVCILDIHGGTDAGFAAYKGVPVGKLTWSGQKVEDLLANLWRQLTDRFKANPLVWYGITNEPHDIAPAVWFAAAQKVINAIRSTGSTSPISMPGTAWSGASSWVSSGNATAWNLKDPAKNLHVQLHLYLSPDSSGVTTDIASIMIGVERLRDAVVWARGKGLRIFIGEVGLSAAHPYAAAAWANLNSYMEANADVILGWCWWAAGPPAWWGNYQFTLCPKAGVDSAQMRLIAPSFAILPEPVDPVVALQAANEKLATENETLRTEIQSMITTIAGLRADVLGLKADVIELTEQNDTLSSELATLREDALALLAERDALTAVVAAVKAAVGAP